MCLANPKPDSAHVSLFQFRHLLDNSTFTPTVLPPSEYLSIDISNYPPVACLTISPLPQLNICAESNCTSLFHLVNEFLTLVKKSHNFNCIQLWKMCLERQYNVRFCSQLCYVHTQVNSCNDLKSHKQQSRYPANQLFIPLRNSLF